MKPEFTPYVVLASFPIALVIFGISVRKNMTLLGRLIGLGVIVISPILSILYIDRFICRPTYFCELMGILYYFLVFEAIVLLILFFVLGNLIHKKIG